MVYKMKQEDVRRKMANWSLWGFFDDGDGTPKDMRTVVIQGKEVAVAGPDYSVRLPLREMSMLLKLLDGHFETIRDGVIMYDDAHRGD